MQAVVPRHRRWKSASAGVITEQFHGEAALVKAVNALDTYTGTAGASSVSVYRPVIIMIGPFSFAKLPARDDKPAVLDADSLGPRN